MEKQNIKKNNDILVQQKNKKNIENKGVSKKKKAKEDKHLGLFLDPELHRYIKSICKYECRSMRGLVLYLLRQYVIDFKKKNKDFDFEKFYK